MQYWRQRSLIWRNQDPDDGFVDVSRYHAILFGKDSGSLQTIPNIDSSRRCSRALPGRGFLKFCFMVFVTQFFVLKKHISRISDREKMGDVKTVFYLLRFSKLIFAKQTE